MKSTFLCEVFVLRLSDNVSHLGVFFGLLSAFSAGATYVVIRFLGTAKADEFVWICWSFNEGSWMFWRLLSLLGLPDFAWKFGRSIGLQCCLPKHWVRSSSRHSRLLCPVNNWGHSGNFQYDSVIYFFRGIHCQEFGIANRHWFRSPSRLFSRPQMVLGLMIGFTGFVSQIAMTKGMQKAPACFEEMDGMDGWRIEQERKWDNERWWMIWK